MRRLWTAVFLVCFAGPSFAAGNAAITCQDFQPGSKNQEDKAYDLAVAAKLADSYNRF